MAFSISQYFRFKKREKTEIIKNIIEDGYPKRDFFIINGIATLIAVLGYMQSSTAVIIGSMLIATLLYPIVGIGLGISSKNRKLIILASKSLIITSIISLIFGVFCASIISFFTPLEISPTLTDQNSIFLVGLTGFSSGIGAAFILSKKALQDTVAGVAIAVALIPPLAVSAIGISYGNSILVTTGLTNYGLSVITLIIGSAIVFYFMHFSSSTHAEDKAIANTITNTIQQEKREESKDRE